MTADFIWANSNWKYRWDRTRYILKKLRLVREVQLRQKMNNCRNTDGENSGKIKKKSTDSLRDKIL